MSLKAIDLRIRRRLFGLSRKFLVRKVTFCGRKWKIPVIDNIGYGLAQGHLQESWIYDELKRQFTTTPISVFIDIGTNIGQTFIKVKSLDDRVPYIGYDPNPNCIYYLQQLTALNAISAVSLSCIGIGDACQLSTFHYAGMDDVCGTLSSEHISGNAKQSITIPVWPLDKIPFAFPRPGNIIVKIDVEGYELAVIKGAVSFIAQYKPILMVEILPHQGKPSARRNEKEIFDLLRQWQYDAFRLTRSGTRVEMVSMPDNVKDFNEVDYLFIPVS